MGRTTWLRVCAGLLGAALISGCGAADQVAQALPDDEPLTCPSADEVSKLAGMAMVARKGTPGGKEDLECIYGNGDESRRFSLAVNNVPGATDTIDAMLAARMEDTDGDPPNTFYKSNKIGDTWGFAATAYRMQAPTASTALGLGIAIARSETFVCMGTAAVHSYKPDPKAKFDTETLGASMDQMIREASRITRSWCSDEERLNKEFG